MARPTVSPLLPLFLLLLLLLAAAAASGASSAAGVAGELPLGWIPGAGSGCRGSIGECLAGTEFELASEASRRILARSYYISYAALRRDSVPCSRRGASYYNCRPGAQANPYSRSCSAITRCRR
ncbi:rapid alkalinization factor-like [Curcuma longa]|uniref:rapid alkalinization factor-like n=1 Tax=Curcuma longa TaxID=136217 RepID=UPI003D9E10D8